MVVKFGFSLVEFVIRGKGFECLVLEGYVLNWRVFYVMLIFSFL